MSIPSSSSHRPLSLDPKMIEKDLKELSSIQNRSELQEKTQNCIHMILQEIESFSTKEINNGLMHTKHLLEFSQRNRSLKEILMQETNFSILNQAFGSYTSYLQQNCLPTKTQFSRIEEQFLKSLGNSLAAQKFLFDLVKSNSAWACNLFFILVEKEVPWALNSIQELLDHLHSQSHVLDHLLNLTFQGHKEVYELFLPILISRFEVLYHPMTKDYLSRPFFHKAELLTYALDLAKENPVMQKLLSDDIFRNPKLFIPLLSNELPQGNPISEFFLLSLWITDSLQPSIPLNLLIFSALSKYSEDYAREFEQIGNRLENWFQTISDYYLKEKLCSVEKLPSEVACKIAFANLIRESALLDLIVHKKEKELPSPANHSLFPTTACWCIGSPFEQAEQKEGSSFNLFSHMGSIKEQHGIEIIKNSFSPWADSNIASLQGNIPTLKISSIFSTGLTPIPGEQLSTNERSFAIFSDLLDFVRNSQESQGIESGDFLGQVGLKNSAVNSWSFAETADLPCEFNLCYTEEGNHIIGKDFMIIGRNSVELAKSTTALDIARLGYIRLENGSWERRNRPFAIGDPDLSLITDEEALLLFAHSYGISPEKIYITKQPAAYHLDIAMALIGDRKIMLNDSLEAAQWIVENLEQSQKNEQALAEFMKIAQEKKEIEDKVQAELESFGFEVVRFGGSTYHPIKGYDINLFNFLSATSPKPPHEKVIVSMGCSKDFQNRFRDFLQEHVPDVLPENIHLLDEEWGHNYLKLGGGIRCMTCDFPVPIP